MSVESLNLIVAALATGGLFFLIGGLTGRLRLPLGAQGVSLELEDPRRARLRLSLAARLARMISDALPIGDFGLGGATLEVRLAQSGDLYESPAEFYQRKFSYFVLFAAISLLIGLLLGLALPLSLAISLLLGGFGLFAPESELADRIGKRRRALRREMAFMLDRVAFAVMAYGTFQKTLAQMLRSEQAKAAPQSTETPGAQTRAGLSRWYSTHGRKTSTPSATSKGRSG